MEIEERESRLISFSHLWGKQDVYIKSEESNTTEFDEPGVDNIETITNNRYRKLVTKNRCQITNYENGVTKNQLQKKHYQEAFIK